MAETDSKPYGVVYALVNIANGKMYVGQTTQGVDIRWRQHQLLQGKCRALEAAISKYGADAFYVDTMGVAQTQGELDALEAHWVTTLNTVSPSGYNLRQGGGAVGKMSDGTKALIRELALAPDRLARFNAMRVRPDVLERQRQISKARWPSIASKMVEAHKSPESRAKRSVTLKTHYAQPGAKERLIEARREKCADPQARLNHSAGARAQHAKMTPEQRAARGRKISETKQRLRRERLGL